MIELYSLELFFKEEVKVYKKLYNNISLFVLLIRDIDNMNLDRIFMKTAVIKFLLISSVMGTMQLCAMDMSQQKNKPEENIIDTISQDTIILGKDSRADYNRALKFKHENKRLSPKSEKSRPRKCLAILLAEAIRELEE